MKVFPAETSTRAHPSSPVISRHKNDGIEGTGFVSFESRRCLDTVVAEMGSALDIGLPHKRFVDADCVQGVNAAERGMSVG